SGPRAAMQGKAFERETTEKNSPGSGSARCVWDESCSPFMQIATARRGPALSIPFFLQQCIVNNQSFDTPREARLLRDRVCGG
ncbi:MAG: hypothetical protein N2050_10055, partial [Flavobacteriales bacterium]|nr:hypothetical protein [Flavobacteriales bacterium]